MKLLPLLSALSLLVGCATSPVEPQKDGKVMECYREKPTGLAHYVKVCREKSDVTAQRDKESKEFIENMRQPSATEQSLGR